MRRQPEGSHNTDNNSINTTPPPAAAVFVACPSGPGSSSSSSSSSRRSSCLNLCALVFFACLLLAWVPDSALAVSSSLPSSSGFLSRRGGATTPIPPTSVSSSSSSSNSSSNKKKTYRRPSAAALSTTNMLNTDAPPSISSTCSSTSSSTSSDSSSHASLPHPSPSTTPAKSTNSSLTGGRLFGDRFLLATATSNRRKAAAAAACSPQKEQKEQQQQLPLATGSLPTSLHLLHSHHHHNHEEDEDGEEVVLSALSLAMADANIEKPTPTLLAEGPDFLFEYISQCELPTDRGLFHLRAYRYTHKTSKLVVEPVVMFQGEHQGGKGVWVRVHDQCLTSEVLGSRRCDCKEQLELALDRIVGNGEEGGLVIYLPQEGRGIGLANKVAAYALQEQGLDTVDANLFLGFGDDERKYDYVGFILKDLGVESIRLATNNPFKTRSLRAVGVKVDVVEALQTPANRHNLHYLRTKILKMEHSMDLSLNGGKRKEGEREEGGSLDGTDAATTPELLTDSDKNSVREDLEGLMEDEEGREGEDGLEGEEEDEARLLTAAKAAARAMQEGGNGQVGAGTAAASAAAAAAAAAAELEQPQYCFGKATVEAAIQAMAQGGMVVVVDDEDRENEGDLIMAADAVTTQQMAFIVRYCSGVVCVSLEGKDLDRLALPPMIAQNEDPKHTAFAVSVDYKHGTTTGISAHDRAATLRALADPASKASDFTRPGHIFPLRYTPGGVKNRRGHTEAALDLSRLAGRRPMGVLCEICSEDGSMAKVPELKEFCKTHGLVLTSIADLVAYRIEKERKER
ncbi:bifunctional dihydroxy-2-butanone 4-phosphate synthase gtp cyclohydrolase ii protein [Nannochloropsis oceanica]